MCLLYHVFRDLEAHNLLRRRDAMQRDMMLTSRKHLRVKVTPSFAPKI